MAPVDSAWLRVSIAGYPWLCAAAAAAEPRPSVSLNPSRGFRAHPKPPLIVMHANSVGNLEQVLREALPRLFYGRKARVSTCRRSPARERGLPP